ncbi:MAG: drug/metabolite transporter (DMT)-like permease [Gammaproteobacteria bacterium]|jgi:drug/metabolite transporter (DMT)-like permease
MSALESENIIDLRLSKNALLGYLSAGAVALIWATWLVASRSGTQSSLTVFDLAVLRYGVSAVFALPLVLYFKPWKSMPARRIVILTFLLSPIYILFVFGGFVYAPAAHGGIFMNGVLPAFTLLIGWYWLAEKVTRIQLLGVGAIIVGASLAVADASQLSLADSWQGDLMFVIAAVFFSAYLVLGRLWHIETLQILMCSSVINAIMFVPVWYLFLPSGMADASESQLLIQTLYQGLIPNLLGLLLVATAVRHVGPAATAAFMAAVPGLGTILSLVFLGETPGWLGWLSLFILTPGIIMVAVIRKPKAEGRRQKAESRKLKVES